MNRKGKEKRTTRLATIHLEASTEQRHMIDRAAKLLGKGRSEFMLDAACDRAQSVILDQVFFNLDAVRLRTFNAMLDARLAPHTGLERLKTVRAPWRKNSEA
ncbi:DUF1778 domain-containing protein [Variovorax sp.]|jgi:uncharacterized protein (DUF1778 family)|uniref:type II toxin-antitoxin system TacA family antitoxin n=1 Tax=Variovorax sp. TaxID=1871043 RepID=UPI000C55BC53|nr:DUF1778 domain-containing protein [Variovorax sp.]MBS78493.1 toxin-antitoxin system protein [Variovorax sp.]